MDRTKYIGSSDARDILSGDWDKLFQRKTGALEGPDLSDNFAVQLGVQTEDFHLDWTLRRLIEERGDGFKHSKAKDDGEQHWATFTAENSFNSPLLGSHPDALLRTPDGQVLPLEAKITGRWRNADEAADYYMPQLQHHMLCWGADLLLFSVVIGTSEPERIWVGASPEWQSHYIDRADAFWGHVVKGIPPAPAFFDKAKKPEPIVPNAIASTVPMNGWKKRSLEGDNQAPALIDKFIMTKEAVKEHEDAKKALKSLMREDENELTHPKLVLKRDARGSIRINIAKDAA